MLKSPVEIIVHCGSTTFVLQTTGRGIYLFPHDTSFITGCSWLLYITTLMHLQMSFSRSGVWPDRLHPAATSPQGHRVIPPPPQSLLPVRLDSSISPSCDTATLSVRPNDAENKKLPTFFFFFFKSLQATGPCSLNMIGSHVGKTQSPAPLQVRINILWYSAEVDLSCSSQSLVKLT